MRSRNIKPGFFKNEVLAELPFQARLLFIGLWCLADREGRLEDRPKRIEAEIFPFEKVDIEKHMQALASICNPFIIRYQEVSDGVSGKFIQIIKFLEHQTPNSHEKLSRIPPCICKKTQCTSPSPFPFPDSPTPIIPKGDGYPFEKFYEVYPRKKARAKALKAWEKIEMDQQLFNQILKAIENQKASEQWKKEGGEFIPFPATWLNQKRWEDEIKNQEKPREIIR